MRVVRDDPVQRSAVKSANLLSGGLRDDDVLLTNSREKCARRSNPLPEFCQLSHSGEKINVFHHLAYTAKGLRFGGSGVGLAIPAQGSDLPTELLDLALHIVDTSVSINHFAASRHIK